MRRKRIYQFAFGIDSRSGEFEIDISVSEQTVMKSWVKVIGYLLLLLWLLRAEGQWNNWLLSWKGVVARFVVADLLLLYGLIDS